MCGAKLRHCCYNFGVNSIAFLNIYNDMNKWIGLLKLGYQKIEREQVQYYCLIWTIIS